MGREPGSQQTGAVQGLLEGEARGRRVERASAAARDQGRNYNGGCTILKDWLQPQRQSVGAMAVRRFGTPPGKQAKWTGDIWVDSWRGRKRASAVGVHDDFRL